MKQWNNGLPCPVFKCGLECRWSELILKHKKDVMDSALIHGKYILVHTVYIGSGKMIYTTFCRSWGKVCESHEYSLHQYDSIPMVDITPGHMIMLAI